MVLSKLFSFLVYGADLVETPQHLWVVVSARRPDSGISRFLRNHRH